MPDRNPADRPAPRNQPRYFERPDQHERPLTLLETLLVVLSAHLGVRTKAQREQDFRRANGLHLFIAAILYFSAVIAGLIFLVKYITR
jgi:DUF2970 family protein